MGRPDFENLRVYQLAEQLANEIWKIVTTWEYFSKDTLGKQIVRSADSIGANIAEDNGRYNSKDNQRFVATRAFLCVFRRRGVTRQNSTRISIRNNTLVETCLLSKISHNRTGQQNKTNY